MTGVLLTQSTTFIIGPIAKLLGVLMNFIFNTMDNVFGIQNVGICIILFTIIIYTCMIPLTIKQQKFSKMSAVMNPELQAIQRKYKNKKDQASMLKQQEETQMVYDKYGTNPVGGCGSLLIQMPLLFGLYEVIRNIPAYVDGIKAAYMPLVSEIITNEGFQKVFGKIAEAKPILMDPEKYDFSQANTVIDALYKFQSTSWNELSSKIPELSNVIDQTQSTLKPLHSFLGLNIAESPWAIMTSGAALTIVVLALCIPLFAGLSQWLSVKLMPAQGTLDEDNPMASSMKTMNVTMPLISVFFCFTMPSGLGLYWIVSAVVRTIQQVLINKYLEKKSVEEMIEKNKAKAAKKREKRGTTAAKLNEMAQQNTKNIKKNNMPESEREALVNKANEKRKNAKPGSLASKANMVSDFNDSNK